MDAEAVLRTPLIDWGVAAFTLPGQEESGDRYAVVPFPEGILVAAVDGLGHGAEAAAAAKVAVATVERHAGEPLISTMERCHDNLRETRGAAMTAASFSAPEGIVTWLGVGNVEGLLLNGDQNARPACQSLLLCRGILGGHMPPLSSSRVPVARGDILILATDGVRCGFAPELSLCDPPRQMADLVLARYATGTDDALVLVARYLGGAS